MGYNLPMTLLTNNTNQKSRWPRRWLVVVLLVIVLAYFFLLRPLVTIASEAQQLKKDLTYFKDGIILQNLAQMKNASNRLSVTAARLKNSGNYLIWLKIVPFVNSYYNDFNEGSEAAIHGTKLLSDLLEAVTPVSESIGFSQSGVKIPISGQDRLAGLTKVAPVLLESFDNFESELKQINDHLQRIDPNRYPENYRGTPIRSTLNSAKSTLEALNARPEDIKSFLTLLPDLLGAKDPKTYLVLFQNDKELRATGGFWTAYSLFRLEGGKIVSIQAGDIYFLDIDNRVPFYPPAPSFIQKYLKITDWYIRDTNISPDYRRSVETFNEFWSRVPGVPKTDGVIAIDTYFVQGLLSLVGDIKIPNYETFTSENVVYQLELIATILGSREEKRAGRKDIIGILMRELLTKTFGLPSNKYDKLVSLVLGLAAEKHLLFYFKEPVAQGLLEQYNLAGRINESEGDYLHVNDMNLGGRKANLYIKEAVSKDVTIKNSGQDIISNVTIDYENTGAYNADLNTGYRDYVRLYVPKGSELISSTGSLETVTTGEELNKTYFAAFIAVNPLEKASLTISYRLPSTVLSGKTYHLLIQKQPGTDRYPYEVKVNNHSEKINLVADQTLDISY